MSAYEHGTPSDQLNAIGFTLSREGIRAHTILEGVCELIQRLEQAETLAERYRLQRNAMRQSTYAFAETARLLQSQADQDSEAEHEA